MKKPLFPIIAIVGVGLIGGSIGLAVKKRRLAKLVIGIGRRKSSVLDALKKGAIDVGVLDMDAVGSADLVILAAPVTTIAKQMKALAPHLKKGAVVIDAGSSKALITDAAKKYLHKNTFVGCHPMAGKERSGVAAAEAGLFEDSVCFITARHAKVEAFWKAIGSRPVVLGAEAHDRLIGSMSHTPHAIAFSLFQNKKDYPSGLPVNPSMRELSRLAKSDPSIWADILVSNRQAVLRSVEEFEKKGVHPLKNLLRKGNTPALARFIAVANKNSSRLRAS